MIKLEVKNATSSDKGVYNLIAKNDKGEVVSNPIEVKDVPEEKEEKVEKPTIEGKLKSVVSNYEKCSVCVIFFQFLILIQLTTETYTLVLYILLLK